MFPRFWGRKVSRVDPGRRPRRLPSGLSDLLASNMRSSSIPISSFIVSVSFGLASLLPCLATFSQEEKDFSQEGKEKKPEKESPGEATGSSEEAFEKLFAQFDKEKALEVYKRVATVEKFGIVPTPKSVDFLTKLYDQEKSSVIFEAASRALGRIGTLEAVKTIALFRLVLPDAVIRPAGGREVILRDLQALGMLAGANALIVGNYLTTLGRAPEDDLRMLADLGMPVGRHD